MHGTNTIRAVFIFVYFKPYFPQMEDVKLEVLNCDASSVFLVYSDLKVFSNAFTICRLLSSLSTWKNTSIFISYSCVITLSCSRMWEKSYVLSVLCFIMLMVPCIADLY